jgi:hypothetical protein
MKTSIPTGIHISILTNTGSSTFEGYNNWLNNIMPHTPLALDKMVDFLAGEDNYWQRLLKDPHLWDAKEKEAAFAHARHTNKRCHLSHYRDWGNSPKEYNGKCPTTSKSPIFNLTKDDESEEEDKERSDFDSAYCFNDLPQ